MYNASAAFHTAVFTNSPSERVLFRFADGTIFTNEDLNLSSGLKFSEASNMENELTIGACLSSTIEATISNYHGLLTGFAFGECDVSLGVRTAITTEAAHTANAKIVLRYGAASPITVTGHSTTPYLKVNGEPANIQPSFAVRALVAEGYLVYAIGINGELWAATWTDGLTWTGVSTETWNSIATSTWDDIQGIFVLATAGTPSDFMVAKFVRMATAGRGVAYNAGILYEFYASGTVEKYEYVKLGTFDIDTPAKRKVRLITTTAYDRMVKFDVVADSFLSGLTYPITLGGIYTALCTFVGVTSATTTFINSTRSFTEAPATMENITAREVLGWIAEAACSFARMTRDGELELAWFGTESVMILPTQHFNAEPSEYTVTPIDKLQIKNTENDIGVIIGTGTNAYVILDNPFLYGATDTIIRTYGTPIYNRLSAVTAFTPITVSAVCDWSVEAGDIVSVTSNDVVYAFPVYLQTITWRGGARVVYECTGESSRPIVSAVNRRVYNQKRSVSEIAQYAESITLSVTNSTTSSTIKLMAGAVEISSQNISMSGLVTFTNLTDGTTTISGSNITTGVINASLITTGTLSASRISTGTLTSVSISNQNVQIGANSITFTTSGYLYVNTGSESKAVMSFASDTINIGSSTMYLYIYSGYTYLQSDVRVNGSFTVATGSSCNFNGSTAFAAGAYNHALHGNVWITEKVGFFNTTPIAQRGCAQLSGTQTLDTLKAKINEIIEDLGAYGLLSY